MKSMLSAPGLSLVAILVLFGGPPDDPLPIVAAVPSESSAQRVASEEIDRLLEAASITFRTSPAPASVATAEPPMEMEHLLRHPHIEVRCSHPRMNLFPSILRPAVRANITVAFSRADRWFQEYLDVLEEEEFTAWRYEERWEVTALTDRLASMMGRISYYNGGAHSNYDDIGWTVWEDGGVVTVLRLADLFNPCSLWIEEVAQRVIRQLCEIDHTSAADGLICSSLEAYLEPWSMTPKGIQLQFAAGTMGCFARGPVDAFVSYEEIRHLLNPIGPAAEFLR